jgi:hypothetical protein
MSGHHPWPPPRRCLRFPGEPCEPESCCGGRQGRNRDGGPVSRTGGVLRRALRIVQDREASYGVPADHWARTAAIATVILGDKLKPGEVVSPEQWGLLMIGDKLARRLGPNGGIDQLIDIAGYADGIGRLEEATDGDHESEAEPEGPVA